MDGPREAVAYYELNTCLRFRENGPGPDVVVVGERGGCNVMGMGSYGGEQNLNIGGCGDSSNPPVR